MPAKYLLTSEAGISSCCYPWQLTPYTLLFETGSGFLIFN